MPDDEIDQKIKEAARILREDGHSVRLSKIEEKLNKHFPDDPEPPEPPDPNAPPPPPKKDEPSEPSKPRKKGWWPEGSGVDEE